MLPPLIFNKRTKSYSGVTGMRTIIGIILALIVGYICGCARGYNKARDIYRKIYWKEIDDLKARNDDLSKRLYHED